MQEAKRRAAGERRRKTPSPPSPEMVRTQLARIVVSPEFVAPERVHRFLSYIVEETLAGRADRLKGYAIGVAVFERDEGFDSQADPVVRIEAGRLRRALERYYLVSGRADPVLIEIPKGRYVPTFTRRDEPMTAAPSAVEPPTPTVTERPSPSRGRRSLALALASFAILAATLGILHLRFDQQQPVATAEAAPASSATLLVVPFASLSEGDEAKLYAAGVTEEILTQLSRLEELTVLGHEMASSIRAADPESAIRELAVRYVLTGSLRVSDPRLRVTSRLVEARTGEVLWAQTYEEDLRAKDLLAIQDDIARQVVTAVALPHGAALRADLQKATNEPLSPSMAPAEGRHDP
ncbi:hypothetical protein [Benzoatithermus flavus]|uniref:TolB amino-terminal domain-containing protein n=1 Tax=Benzoatithermus flavus TaxID=3108223 RepID=A0ABU8XT71_9PROT